MITKKLLLSLMLLASLNCGAQKWKMGVTVGGDINTYDIDTQYQYDWRYHDVKGITMGLMGQYQMNEWFALRADSITVRQHHLDSPSTTTASTSFAKSQS